MVNTQNKKKIALVLSGGGIKAAAYHIGVCMALQEKGYHFLGGSQKDVINQRKRLKPSDKKIELYVGSSAGSFIGATLASGRSLESLISAFKVGFGIEKKKLLNPALRPLGYRHIFNLNHRRLLSFIPESILEKSVLSGGIEVLLKKGFKLNGLFNTRGIERYLRKHILEQNEFNQLGVELYVIATQLNHSRKSIFGNFPEAFNIRGCRSVHSSSACFCPLSNYST
jgi:predicted acylesterase/phospholipase RssA